MERDPRSRSAGELSGQEFRQQLDQLFEQHGILDNLRSHLRSLMITVLQQTDVALRPVQRNSPKAQSVSLLVAEYLLRRGCHYTLSVLMSEVSSLAHFGGGPGAVHSKARPGAKGFKAAEKFHFQENEVIEILNSLGFSSCEEHLQSLAEYYIQHKEEESLLECLLGLIRNLQLRQNVQRSVADGRNGLSNEWHAQVSDVMVQARAKTLQLSTAQDLLTKITESEIKRTTEEERSKHMRLLAEREKRIQEYLKDHENEMWERLQMADRELSVRQEIIDKELNERQIQLEKIAFQWNEKHKEIMAMSKMFAGVRAENKTLRASVDKMVSEIKELKIEMKTKTEIIQRLEAERLSFQSHVQEYLKWRNRNSEKEPNGYNTQSASFLTRKDKDILDKEEIVNSDSLGSRVDDACRTDFSFAEDTVLTRVKYRLQSLEEESNRISEKYSKYRQRYEGTEMFSVEGETSGILDEEEVEKEDWCAPITHPGSNAELKERPKRKDRGLYASAVEVCLPSSRETTVEKPSNELESKMITPTKRQQKNHEFYIKSRNLLQILEKSTGIVEAFTSESNSDISQCDLETNESRMSVGQTAEKEEIPSSQLPQKSSQDEMHKMLYERLNITTNLTNTECLDLLQEATHRDVNVEIPVKDHGNFQ